MAFLKVEAMKARTFVICGIALIGIVSVAGLGSNPKQVDSTAMSTPRVTPAQKAELAALGEWHSHFDGVEVDCFQSGNARGFITNPTNRQMAEGAVVIKNSDPSDDAWNSACRQ